MIGHTREFVDHAPPAIYLHVRKFSHPQGLAQLGILRHFDIGEANVVLHQTGEPAVFDAQGPTGFARSCVKSNHSEPIIIAKIVAKIATGYNRSYYIGVSESTSTKILQCRRMQTGVFHSNKLTKRVGLVIVLTAVSGENYRKEIAEPESGA
eukprot:CAMPEP_0194307362 /NCGR_PEP_ID=MMETSP0171-20130528/4264_1 /TAXON_ID=218684 /ORGANISM="Corethron pennatum, Strain L29A3" /LENGTH=151 /DNA_ID=CAMNT_0039059407 /DNA_START=522 /DNA_END=977 /DNA_ORIENTATION=-